MTALGLQRLRMADQGYRPLSPADRDVLDRGLATRYRPVLESGRLFAPELLMLALTRAPGDCNGHPAPVRAGC